MRPPWQNSFITDYFPFDGSKSFNFSAYNSYIRNFKRYEPGYIGKGLFAFYDAGYSKYDKPFLYHVIMSSQQLKYFLFLHFLLFSYQDVILRIKKIIVIVNIRLIRGDTKK